MIYLYQFTGRRKEEAFVPKVNSREEMKRYEIGTSRELGVDAELHEKIVRDIK
jgi:hypothetical protein